MAAIDQAFNEFKVSPQWFFTYALHYMKFILISSITYSNEQKSSKYIEKYRYDTTICRYALYVRAYVSALDCRVLEADWSSYESSSRKVNFHDHS